MASAIGVCRVVEGSGEGKEIVKSEVDKWKMGKYLAIQFKAI